MPSPLSADSLFGFRPRDVASSIFAVAVGSDIIGSTLRSLALVGIIFIDFDQLHFHLHLIHPRQLGGAFVTLALFVLGLSTLFFLGFIRFETPVSVSATGDITTATAEAGKFTSTADPVPRLWLYECEHNQRSYLCFPPYCAPGGLRSRLFPATDTVSPSIEIADSGSEEREEEEKGDTLFPLHDPFNVPFPKKAQNSPSCKRDPNKVSTPSNKGAGKALNKLFRTTNSTNNPLDLILQSPYLPLPYFVKQALEGRQHDWNTLGGSSCSCKRHSLAVEKDRDKAGQNSLSDQGAETLVGDHNLTSPPEHVQKSGRFGKLRVATGRFVRRAVNSYYSLGAEADQSEPQNEKDTKSRNRNPTMTVPPVGEEQALGRGDTEPAPPASVAANDYSDNPAGKPIPQAVLVYHESAHSIVFRDHLRRQQSAIRRTSSVMENSNHGASPLIPDKQQRRPLTGNIPAPSRAPSTILEASESDLGYESGGSRGSTSGGESSTSVTSAGSGQRRVRRTKSGLPKPPPKATESPEMQPVVIANFQPVIEPFEALDLDSSNTFEPLLNADPMKTGAKALEMSDAEIEVVELLRDEQAAVKTIRNADWTSFMSKFKPSDEDGRGTHEHHPSFRKQKEPNGKNNRMEYPFNSFVTSTSLLPSCAKKMRCFGSTKEYAVGVVFGMPKSHPTDASEDDAAKRTRTWSWPSGYSAKTEFNIDHHGNLINGREEALVPLSGRMVKGGLSTIPYNEVYLRAGGLGRVSGGVDVATGKRCDDAGGSGRSFDHGVGLPIALFIREGDYGHLVRLLRTRARYSSIFGSDAARGIPLLLLSPELGVRVFTEKLQHEVLKTMAWDLNPFQNPSLAHRTSIDNTSEPQLQQKLEELLDLDDDKLKQSLTAEEMARIAGGFGATDESVANLLNQAMQRDILEETNKTPHDSAHNLQDLVNEGLAFALRANDYHTSRQLLILYTLVASRRKNSVSKALIGSEEGYQSDTSKASASSQNWRDAEKAMEEKKERHLSRDERTLGKHYVPPPPPPPPLDTDRLRSATNSDGLLAVLGAAQVLRAMQDGSAKRRVKESIDSIEEWIENGEQSVAFRVASWRDQRAAQGDLKIAMENDSNFMAFISNKAISNRKKFAKQLRDAAEVTDFDSLKFLRGIHSMLSQMNSPCLRLELLQYILGLDNRYSVAHVTRSVELAATCLNLSENDEGKMQLEWTTAGQT
ncbi:hypothetical protein ACHAWF_011551 [Thalassiosira exigua]